MPKLIAVKGMTLLIKPPVVTGEVTVVTLPSLKIKATGIAVYRGPVQISISGVTEGNFVAALPTTGSLQPSATKGKADNQFVLREGDQAAGLTASGSDPSTGTTKTINFSVEVTVAGQLKARSD